MEADKAIGIQTAGTVYRDLSPAQLVELAIVRGEGVLAANGALVTTTGKRTGRSPGDRYFVSHGESGERVDWGQANRPVEPDVFDRLWDRARDHLSAHDVFVVNAYIGADPQHRMNLRVITNVAWHALFALQLFRRRDPAELDGAEPDFLLMSAPEVQADPERDGTNSEAFIGVDLERKRVLIVGTQYAGEMKKSIFTSANYLFASAGVLTMHCSANMGRRGDVALFFGLSGTGKTTLSADPERRLIGDDEHGWSDGGIFNLEGGCYAKCINLSQEKEPQIWSAIRFGSIVENVVVDERTREVDYEDDSITENTRAAYPLEFIPGYVPEGRGGHAENIVFLAADAFGVLPPVSKLDHEGAMYHFLSGFTSKLAGTEAGMGSEPEATFSTCFGSPFLPLAPQTYAGMLGEQISRHNARVFLVNTGWSGGPFGVGERMDIGHTRALIRAATSGALDDVATKRHPIFNVDVPLSCPGVPEEVLDPQATWSDKDAYEAKARELARLFNANFQRYAASVPPGVIRAGPTPD